MGIIQILKLTETFDTLHGSDTKKHPKNVWFANLICEPHPPTPSKTHTFTQNPNFKTLLEVFNSSKYPISNHPQKTAKISKYRVNVFISVLWKHRINFEIIDMLILPL